MQELKKILEEFETRRDFAFEKHKIDAVIAYEVCANIVKKHMNDGWIPVEEALPDEEAEEYIKKKLHGIGYLYPCLVTYRSPMTNIGL